MEKTKLLTLSVIGLLLLNLGTLGFLFLNGNREHRGPHGEGLRPKDIIIEKLHFDAAQQQEYEKLIQWHQGEIRRIDDNIRQAKNELYTQLSQPETNLTIKDSLVSLLANYQKQIEETHFKHFHDIKKLCHQNQLADFKIVTGELGRMFAPKPHRPEHE